MIIGPDFVWLHVPKCGGTSIERSLRNAFRNRRDVHFDRKHLSEKDARGRVIWHHTIKLRHEHDPAFDPSGKKIVAAIRRLPNWLLSRVHYEANRSAGMAPTREQFVLGEFLEHSGVANSPEKMIRRFNRPPVDDWLRVEHLTDDMIRVFGIDPADMVRANESKIDYIKDLSFWFTKDELRALYKANPTWAEIEEKAYGGLPV